MAPKPKLRQYRQPIAPAGELHPAARAFLLTGEMPADTAPSEVRGIAWDDALARRWWREHRRSLLAEAKRRGFSPWGLYAFEDRTLRGLRFYGNHAPTPRLDRPAMPCPSCGSAATGELVCLSREPE